MVGTILLDMKKELDFESNKLKIFPENKQFSQEKVEIFDFDASTGVVRLSSGLDREKLCPNEPECVLKYRILRQNPFSVTKLEFEIEDINDNQPTFPKPYMKTTISESTPPGKFFLLHLAEDEDSPRFGVVDYYMDPGQLSQNLRRFHLEVEKSQDGKIHDVWLHTNEPLDREEQTVYLLHIIAADGGNKTGAATVEVTVLDLNDNQPQFKTAKFELSVFENTPPGKQLLILTATDYDAGENSLINYSLADKSKSQFGKYFRLNQTTGILSLLKRLDYEEMTSIQLEVIAKDQGIDPLSSKATVTINVENINDNQPKIAFEKGRKEVRLPEDVPRRTKVLKFSVSDADGDTNVQCHLSVNQVIAFDYDGALRNSIEKL